MSPLRDIGEFGRNLSCRWPVEQKAGGESDLAFRSLIAGLRAYFSTFKDVESSFADVKRVLRGDAPHEQTGWMLRYIPEFVEHSAQTVLHFHHSAELTYKAVFRDYREHLSQQAQSPEATPARATAIATLKHLDEMEQDVEAKRRPQRRSLSISEIRAELKNGRGQLPEALKWAGTNHNLSVLDALNSLRNQASHEGVWVLSYGALDEFVGVHLAPFVRDALAWGVAGVRERSLRRASGVAVLHAIHDTFADRKYKIGQVALLKEIGRALLVNPAEPDGSHGSPPSERFLSRERARLVCQLDQETGKREAYLASERAVRVRRHGVDPFDVRKCPVCGVLALVGYAGLQEVPGESTLQRRIERVRCECCTFSVSEFAIGRIPRDCTVKVLGGKMPNLWDDEEWGKHPHEEDLERRQG